MRTMKAAVVPELGAKLEIRELPVPEPGPGQVLVRMQTSGLCHTDIHAAAGDWPVKPNPPFIPGHEGVGIIEATGPGGSLHKVGDRVAIAWLGKACGHCSYCIDGWETLCESQENSGYSVDGAWAEYAVAFDSHVVTVPEAVSSFDAAPLACAGVTTFKAVKVSRIQPGETAVIFGVGGLGHLGLQYAREFGGRVIAVDIEDSKLDLARQLGADYVVNARTSDPVEAIRDLGGADRPFGLHLLTGRPLGQGRHGTQTVATTPGVVRKTTPGERRAAKAPDVAARLCGAGMKARIEAVAGASARSPDSAYAGGPRTIRAIAASISCAPPSG